MRFTRNASPLFVPQPNHSPRKINHLAIQGFQLSGLAMQLCKNPDLRSKQFGNDRDRNVVYSAVFITLQSVRIREKHSRDEEDCRVLKPGMLANHIRQLKAIDVRHTYVQKYKSNISF